MCVIVSWCKVPHTFQTQMTYLFVWIAYEALWLFLFFFLLSFLLALFSVDLERYVIGDSSNMLTSPGRWG